MTRDKANRRPLCVEALEDRMVLNAAVWVGGNGTLHIEGNGAKDFIRIVQDDGANTLTVMASSSDTKAPEVFNFQSSSISRLKVNLGGGDDTFTYELLGSSFDYAKLIKLNLGQGNDQANFLFGAAVEPGAEQGVDDSIVVVCGPCYGLPGEVAADDSTSMDAYPTSMNAYEPSPGPIINPEPTIPLVGGVQRINADLCIVVDGGAGADQVFAQFGDVAEGVSLSYTLDLGAGDDVGTVELVGDLGAGADVVIKQSGQAGADALDVHGLGDRLIAVDGRLIVRQGGGADADAIRFSYSGVIDGELLASSQGSEGADFVSHDLAVNYFSQGKVRSNVVGGAGADTLENFLRGQSLEVLPLIYFQPADLMGTIDGGSGLDSGTATANVLASGMESMSVVL